jgi:hypothetical protein
MLIDHGCRLRTAVAIQAVEIERADAMLAEGAFESDAAVQLLGRIVSHVSSVVLSSGPGLGQRVCNLRAGNTVARGTAFLPETSSWCPHALRHWILSPRSHPRRDLKHRPGVGGSIPGSDSGKLSAGSGTKLGRVKLYRTLPVQPLFGAQRQLKDGALIMRSALLG